MIAVIKLIGKYLRKNKKRNLFIGIAIMISSMLLTSLVMVIGDFKNIRYTETVNFDGGEYDGEVHTKDKELIKTIKGFSIFDSARVVVKVGEPIKVKDEYFMQLNGYDDKLNKVLNFNLKEGRYPKAKDEIALESWIVENLNPVPKIGDKIKLSYNMMQKSEKKNQYKNIQVNDEFTFVGTFEYIHLFDEKRHIAKAYVTEEYAEYVLKNEGKYTDGDINYDIYVKLKPNSNIKLLESQLDNSSGTVELNYFRERRIQAINKFDVIGNILYSIIIITSTIIIYNMFNSAMIIRMPQMGMLKALGLTPKQLKWLVVGEGLILGAVFIPLGNLVGHFIYRIMMYFIGGEFNYNITDIPVKAVKIALICGFVAIFLGTLSSVRKIRDMSAIEAISCSSYLDIKNVRFKDTKDLGGTQGKFLRDIARCNIKRNKMKFVMSTISIVIAIVLFVLIKYIMDAQSPAYGLKNKFGSDFIVKTVMDKKFEIPKNIISDLENVKGVKNIEKLMITNLYLDMPKEKLKDDSKGYIAESARKYKSYAKLVNKGFNIINIMGNGYEIDEIEKLKPRIEQGNIDLKVMENEPVCIMVQNLNYNKVTDFKVGDKLKLYASLDEIDPNDLGMDKNQSKEITITIGAILKNDKYIKNDGAINTEIIMSDTVMKKYFKMEGINKVKISVKDSKDYDSVNEEIVNITKENPNLQLLGYKEELAKSKEQYFKVGVALGSFIAINALASIVNIFSVMTMNIVLRKKEFSMLRAIGMSNSEVKKMIIYEGMIYGGFGGILGLALGVPLTYLFFILMRKRLMQGMIWNFPLLTIIGVTLTVIAVCLLASITSSRKLFKDGIIEGVRAVE